MLCLPGNNHQPAGYTRKELLASSLSVLLYKPLFMIWFFEKAFSDGVVLSSTHNVGKL